MNALVAGIAGGTGAGKTTLARLIAGHLPDRALIIEHDWYYRDQGHLAPEDRARVNYDHPGALETDLLVTHLERLCAGETVEAPRYDFTLHTRAAGTRTLTPREVLLVPGIHVLGDPRLARILHLSVFIDLPADLRFIRRLRRDLHERGRDVDSVIAQYLASVRPMYERCAAPLRAQADLVLGETDDLAAAAAGIARTLRAVLDA